MLPARSEDRNIVRLRAFILTALREEYEAVRNQLRNLQEHTHDQGTVYQIGEFSASSGLTWEVCLAEIGAGNARAAQETERAIALFKPQVAMFVGVAGGLKDVSIGDVVVGTKVYAYESGKAQKEFYARPEVHNSAYDLEQRARAQARGSDWIEDVTRSDGLLPRIYVGPIASGEKVVASRHSVFYNFIRENYGDALAVEMEGWGFLDAIQSHPEVHALVVRGISDLVAGKSRADAMGSQLQAARNASAVAFSVLRNYRPLNLADKPMAVVNTSNFERNAEVEDLLKTIELGDWNSSADAAIQLIQQTRPDGSNPVFDAVLKYYDCVDEDLRWAAFQVIESAVTLSPNLITRNTLTYFASHPDFSVRASAASICMELAGCSPASVPIDILIPLSVYDEDWYVHAPANAALKTLARSMPHILRIFISRLHSRNPQEREHAAGELADVGRNEPELLDEKEMRREIMLLKEPKDKNARRQLEEVLSKVRNAPRQQRYRYGL